MSAEEFQGVTRVELGQASRNHGMHLEGLRYDVTPPGMHYLDIHFDIPPADEAAWTVEVDGLVERALSLSVDDPGAAGGHASRDDGVRRQRADADAAARREPAVVPGSHRQRRVDWDALCRSWRSAVCNRTRSSLVFTGADHGIQGDVEQDYQWGFTLADILRDEVLLAYEMNGQRLAPARVPLRLLVPDWYGCAA